MSRSIVRWLCLLLALAALPAFAQTRAWLDRAEITYGETVALNIATDQAVAQIDYAPLRAQFELGGQSVRRSFELANGRSRTVSVFCRCRVICAGVVGPPKPGPNRSNAPPKM